MNGLGDDRGASAVEYALVAISVAALVVLVVFALGGYTTGMFATACERWQATGAANASTQDC
jgi:Flp pilus assembly pilin Flp